jgi:O-acetyl-ADP-ribose deacetylase
MTQWHVKQGDILDAQADGLICSANPFLNLSGGVGGALALRYGQGMQQFLHLYLKENGLRFVSTGSTILSPACGTNFKAVAHAVSVDALYETTAETILKTYNHSLLQLSAVGCRTIAAACLACGYGRFSVADFVSVAVQLFKRHYPNIDSVTLVTTNAEIVFELSNVTQTLASTSG